MNKKGIEMAFSWIFAIIAGAVILFSAIYITTRMIGTERKVSDTLVAAELDNLLHPIETNLEDSKYVNIRFVDETRVFNNCSAKGVFGKQQISTASKLIGNDWGEQSVRKTSFNKYIFSRGVEEGKKIHAIVKPFEMPFKIADLTILYGGNYCFVNPPSDIEDEINDLSGDGVQDVGVNISTSLSACPQNAETVCFNMIGCDTNVNTLGSSSNIQGSISKDGETVYYYGGSLLLAAIFSDTEIYECQIKRLMSRAGELGAVYAKKATYLEGSGCSNNLVQDLQSFVVASAINNSHEFVQQVVNLANDLEERNGNIAKCKVF